ncbi:DUF3077 domain-containing protein [Pseudomonas sp. LJDD11]|uniref:DUF6124 family protein n=1 Tax=unclassified Pseudomonas TaxID=196821 RepID=UPI0004F92358|nr:MULTISPECIES: hypothetical protein [unclassified Pseudomonas]MCO8165459.1 DUF3077 domain-containing protein [Pseudomonas sp. 21LCFQ010]MCQ9426252.1 DUF3077 domain-containing protein [Pseudomonas sp. LJDD11]BAP41612.1 putative uncharacterized protein [Pseudomonas sp. StFLB209]
MKKIVPDPPSLESSLTLVEGRLAHAVELLRCATATVYESADALQGPPRHLAMAGMHLITQAHLVLDQVLDQWPVIHRESQEQAQLPA